MGRVMIAGGRPVMMVPGAGILASNLAVGSTVKLMEGSTAAEYLVVNQGIPSKSAKYNYSCDGTWLLRKEICGKSAWNNSYKANPLGANNINKWLNGDFFNGLGSIEQSTIKQVSIPYNDGDTTWTSLNGFSCKLFMLSFHEVGFTVAQYVSGDGALLTYFESDPDGDKRIAKYNGTVYPWWLRSTNTTGSTAVYCVRADGSYNSANVSNAYGIRPALILPYNALFDEDTLLLKGVL